MQKINTSGLERFSKKISLYNNGFEYDTISQQIAEKGVDIIRQNYGSRQLLGIDISKEGKGERKITVSGVGISFDEYGTGNVGKGTYEGDLPTELIEFESPAGKHQETQGWIYNYPNKLTKVNGGWYFGHTFTKGQKAQAQMFNSAKDLRKEMVGIALKVIKGVKG